jgi:hypothetical protein
MERRNEWNGKERTKKGKGNEKMQKRNTSTRKGKNTAHTALLPCCKSIQKQLFVFNLLILSLR